MPILCGTDLSAASGGALAVGRALAAQRGEREIILAHVIAASKDDAALERARAELDALIATANASNAGTPAAEITVRVEVLAGTADSALADFADTEGCDLIVIAARSTGGSGSLLRLGTTAERIVRTAQLPVLVVRDPLPWLAFARGERPLRVLIGVDDSATCDLGIQWVHALRTRGTVDVVLGAIYYSDVASEHFGVGTRTLVDRDPEIERLMARDLMRRFGDRGVVAGTVTARPKRGLGRIGDHLLELARDEAVDAIVIGTSQKTGLGRLGSVSSVVVHDATQAVICMPPNAVVPTSSVPVLRSALVATDLSPFANRAVAYAFAIDADRRRGPRRPRRRRSRRDVEEAALQAQLAGGAHAGRRAADAVVCHVVRGADAATALAQTAARLGVDVICIASHGRSGISRALVGSVADRLLRVTRLPVLVLRPAG